jgi:hypothetical protein
MKELELLGFMVYNILIHTLPQPSLWSIFWKEKKIQNTTLTIQNEPVPTIWQNQKNEQVIEQVNEQLYIYIIKKQTVKNNLNNTK